MTALIFRAVVGAAAIVALGGSGLYASIGNSLTLELTADTGLSGAVYATHSPDPVDANKLFTVHQSGQIRIVELDTNSVLPSPFLTVSGGSGESGLVGLAFHPNYASNGRFFINRHDDNQLPRNRTEGRAAFVAFPR